MDDPTHDHARSNPAGPRFLEVQPMHQNTVIRVLVPVSMLTLTAILGSVALTVPPSQRPGMLLVWAGIIAVELSVLFVFRQRVRVGGGVVDAVFFPLPFWRRRVRIDTIESADLVKVNPLTDFGGWGVRKSRKYGLAFIVSGEQAVFITYDDGKKLLLGSRRGGELVDAIHAESDRVPQDPHAHNAPTEA